MAFCKKCGAQMEDGAAFCPACGDRTKVSGWDGSVFDTFVNGLIASLIISCTCGIATPWAICYMMKFVVGHATIDGKKLSFDGDGVQLFGLWIKWWFLCLITCGIYSLWVTPELYKWACKHIHTKG